MHWLSRSSPVVRSRQRTRERRSVDSGPWSKDRKLPCLSTMQRSTSDGTSKAFVSIHPLDPEDAATISSMRTAARAAKGLRWRIDARAQFDALMERVSPPDDVTFESGTVGDIPGLWVHPASSRSGEAILHLHGGWFHAGSARAYRHLVGHIAARAGTRAFVPDYRLAPEHPFPAAVDDVLATYRGMDDSGIRRIAVTGDSAGGNLALVLASSRQRQRRVRKGHSYWSGRIVARH